MMDKKYMCQIGEKMCNRCKMIFSKISFSKHEQKPPAVHKPDTLTTELSRYTSESIDTNSLAKHLNRHLVTLCLKKYKSRCSEVP